MALLQGRQREGGQAEGCAALGDDSRKRRRLSDQPTIADDEARTTRHASRDQQLRPGMSSGSEGMRGVHFQWSGHVCGTQGTCEPGCSRPCSGSGMRAARQHAPRWNSPLEFGAGALLHLPFLGPGSGSGARGSEAVGIFVQRLRGLPFRDGGGESGLPSGGGRFRFHANLRLRVEAGSSLELAPSLKRGSWYGM